jgi:uncharacterized paraquat-inducible protein A
MIELTFASAFMLYLCLTLFMLFGLWIYNHYCSRRKEILPCEQELTICEYCHFAYLEDSAKKLTQCPQCESYNQ